MGCWGSKNNNNAQTSSKQPEVAELEVPMPLTRKLSWTKEAYQWRWLLRTSQSLVAACLYVVSTWVRAPSLPVPLQLLLALLLAPPFSLAYHWLSLNQAGGYYDTYLEMFTELPRHLQDIQRRNSLEYHAEIEHERRDGIVRTVNGLEAGILFLAMAFLGALCSSTRHSMGFASDFAWRCVETCVYFGLHRTIGSNIFEGRYMGLLQPEAMWYFECVLADSSTVDCRMTPILQHPEPSY